MSSVPPEPAALPAGISPATFAGLFQAVNGLRNRRALAAMMGCTVVGVVLVGLLMAMSGVLGMLAGLLAFIVWLVAAGTGVNAAGLLQMDQARGVAPRSLVDALVQGLSCIPKVIVLGIALFLVEIAVFLVIAILLFICKIPFLGPLLFTVVFPVSIVVAGLTVVGLFLCLVLSLPAIWQGAPIMRALSQTLAIARSRPVEAILLLVAIYFLTLAVGLVIFLILGAGLLPTMGMSMSIVGFGGLGGMMSGGAPDFGGGGAGHAIAGTIGSLVLWAIVVSLVGQVYLLGLCIVYLRLTDGLDLGAAEAELRQRLDEARRKAGELGDKARAAAARDGSAASTMPPPASPVGPVSAQAFPPPVSTAPAPPPIHPPAASAAAFVAPAAAAFPAAYTPPPPAAPPAYSPPPQAAPPAYAPPATVPDLDLGGTDIDLPFDEPAPTPPSATPSFSPPAYLPPGPAQMPAATPAPATMPAPTTCPQCLSPITADDVFCGVCGYRLK